MPEEYLQMAERKQDPTTTSTAERSTTGTKKARAPRLSQEDVPTYSLEQALRVPRAIAENYAYKPTRPLNVAGAMGMTPTSGPFRAITGSAVAYGLTTGAAQAPEIGITPLGLRVVRPTSEGDDIAAKRDALLRPKVVGEFLRSYDGAALPTENIAKNVLHEMGVPAERVDTVLELIVDSAKAVGFIREWGGKRYVDLASPVLTVTGASSQNLNGEPAERDTPSVAVATKAPNVSIAPGINITIEIHIAADATSETIQEIFRNMRRYILGADSQVDDDSANQR